MGIVIIGLEGERLTIFLRRFAEFILLPKSIGKIKPRCDKAWISGESFSAVSLFILWAAHHD